MVLWKILLVLKTKQNKTYLCSQNTEELSLSPQALLWIWKIFSFSKTAWETIVRMNGIGSSGIN